MELGCDAQVVCVDKAPCSIGVCVESLGGEHSPVAD